MKLPVSVQHSFGFSLYFAYSYIGILPISFTAHLFGIRGRRKRGNDIVIFVMSKINRPKVTDLFVLIYSFLSPEDFSKNTLVQDSEAPTPNDFFVC